MSLIEIMIATGMMGIMMMVMITMQTNQLKTNSYLEFQLHRTQLQGAIIGQFLNDPNNCRCLFNGSSQFNSGGTALLTGYPAINQIGSYTYTPPINCATATMPTPLITTTPNNDGLVLNSIQIRNIQPVTGLQYSAQLFVDVSTTKSVLGPSRVPIAIPIAVTTVLAGGGNVRFATCQSAAIPVPPRPRCRVVVQSFDHDSCTGNQRLVYSNWSDNVSTGAVAWPVGSTGYGNRNGMNWNPGDIACMRTGIECQ